MEQVWTQMQGNLREKLGSQNYEIWIRPIHVSAAGPDEVHLHVPNRYYRDWVQDNYGTDLNEEFETALGAPVKLHFLVARGQASSAPDASPTAAPTPNPDARPPIPGVSPDKTFENFVVGTCNQLAHAAALAVCDAPGHPRYNPLFIYGSTGLGKTHLMHAIGNRVRLEDADAQVLYVTAEQFTNELIDALRYRRMPGFRDRFRKHPTMLLIDDVQFLSGKDRTQEELFHTFEFLKERGRQIVFTADVLPREIKGLEPRLRTRCENGMLADTQPPDMETMMAILRQKAEDLSISVPDDVAQWLAQRIRGNVRELEGALNRLSVICRFQNMDLDLEMARNALGHMLAEEPHAISAAQIIETVASFYGTRVHDLKGARRHKQLVRPRHVAMWLVRKHTELSFPAIGREFGNRDNATVQHACKKIRNLLQRDADLRNAVETLERSLGG